MLAVMTLTMPSDVVGAKVTRLTAAGASADSGVAWGGLSWNYTSTGGRLAQSGQAQYEPLEISKGMANLTIPSTEAVVVMLYRTSACS